LQSNCAMWADAPFLRIVIALQVIAGA